MLLRNTCDLAAEILDGAHDADLAYLEQAVRARRRAAVRKTGLYAGSRIRIEASAPTKDPSIIGMEARVEKVNQKTFDIDQRFLRIPLQWVERGHVTVL